MFQILDESANNVLIVRMTGKLHDEDYKDFVPKAEAVIAKEGNLRLLIIFDEFEGWDAHAAWDDFKFGMENASKIEKLGMVGDKDWQKWSAKLSRFTIHDSRFFETEDLDKAKAWARE